MNSSRKFTSSSTALEVSEGIDLTGKVVIVTGCNTGIGYETARALVLRGAEVIFACRSATKAEDAVKKLQSEKSDALCQVIILDLSSLKSVQAFVQEFRKNYTRLDILILNAGVFCSFGLTEDKIEQSFQVNHLSQFYLTILLKPCLINSSQPRIVVLSSETHRWQSFLSTANISEEYLSPNGKSKYTSDWTAYADSKLCNILFAYQINKLWKECGIICTSVHPGFITTNIVNNAAWFVRVISFLVQKFAKSLEQGAATSVYCATAPELNDPEKRGIYYWDFHPYQPAQVATDEELAEKLWDISKTMLEKSLGEVDWNID